MLVDAAVCVWGAWFAFPTGAALSGISLALFALAYSGAPDQALLAVSIVSLAGTIANVVAFRIKPSIAEQANPMNLPVFG